jgi:hypothetical protein
MTARLTAAPAWVLWATQGGDGAPPVRCDGPFALDAWTERFHAIAADWPWSGALFVLGRVRWTRIAGIRRMLPDVPAPTPDEFGAACPLFHLGAETVHTAPVWWPTEPDGAVRPMPPDVSPRLFAASPSPNAAPPPSGDGVYVEPVLRLRWHIHM